MDERPDEIIDYIESQRSQLGSNLNELESRVRSTTDWRTHFDNSPLLMMAVAMGGGLMLGSLVMGGKKKSSWSSSRYSGNPSYSMSSSIHESSHAAKSSGPATSLQKQKVSETLDNVKAALIGFATSKAKEFLTQALPGFDHHLSETEKQTQSASNPVGQTHTHGGEQHTHPGGTQPHTHSEPGKNTAGRVVPSRSL